jgi:hypothetical protein
MRGQRVELGAVNASTCARWPWNAFPVLNSSGATTFFLAPRDRLGAAAPEKTRGGCWLRSASALVLAGAGPHPAPLGPPGWNWSASSRVKRTEASIIPCETQIRKTGGV